MDMDDAVITHESYCQRLSRSCAGVGAGIVIFLAGLSIAGWNEYRNVGEVSTRAVETTCVLPLSHTLFFFLDEAQDTSSKFFLARAW
jgi:hypothetical protein